MSRFLTSVLVVAIAAVIGLNVASAAEEKKGKEGRRPQMDPEQAFKKLDTNGDGKLSLEEWSKGPMAQRAEEGKRKDIFAKIDANGDGGITLDELKAAHEKFMKAREAHGKGKGGERKKEEKK